MTHSKLSSTMPMTIPATARFPLGAVVVTANAANRLTPQEIAAALHRHQSGDWGDLCPQDALSNEIAVDCGGRVFSAYGEGSGRFWIITEDDQRVTTVLLPLDY